MIDDENADGPMPDDNDVQPIVVELAVPNEVVAGTFNVEKLADELRAAGIIERVRGYSSTFVEIDPQLSAEDRAALQRVLDAHQP